jgi:hypothetical protein
MVSAIRVKWLPPATMTEFGESFRQRLMVWMASGDRQVAEQVIPMTSAFDVEMVFPRSLHGRKGSGINDLNLGSFSF